MQEISIVDLKNQIESGRSIIVVKFAEHLYDAPSHTIERRSFPARPLNEVTISNYHLHYQDSFILDWLEAKLKGQAYDKKEYEEWENPWRDLKALTDLLYGKSRKCFWLTMENGELCELAEEDYSSFGKALLDAMQNAYALYIKKQIEKLKLPV